jgi:hypothetical protein
VQDLHNVQIPVHEDKHYSIPDILVHGRGNNTGKNGAIDQHRPEIIDHSI